MLDLLENQRVTRRRSPVRPELKTFSKTQRVRPVKNRKTQTGPSSAGYSASDMVREMKQHPRRHKVSFSVVGEGENAPPKKTFGFSIPLLPAAGVLMFLLGTVLAVGSYEHFSFDWLNKDVVAADPSGESEFAMAGFKGPAETASENQAASQTEAAPASLVTITEDAAADIPLDLAETFQWRDYVVQKGDTVSKIAADHALSMDAVIASNDITNARFLKAGETIRLPNMDGIPYKVKKGDSLSKISKSMGVPLEAILDANDIERDVITAGETIFIPGARMKSEDLKLALGELFIYPLKGGRLSSAFGWRNDPISGVRRHHAAIDIAASTGTAVKAAGDGKVSAVGFNATYGNYIIISHGNNFQTMYAHLSVVSVKKGDAVTQGGKIGEVGSTGYSTGPHLHFAVYRNGQAVNPLDYLHT